MNILHNFSTALKDPQKALSYLVLGQKRAGRLFKPHSCSLMKEPKNTLEEFMIKSSSIHEHLATLNMLTIEHNLKNILEMGTQYGQSTISLLLAAKEIGGHVTSIDIDSCLEAKKTVKQYNLEDYWTFIQGDDTKVEWDNSIDHLFIDSLHTYDHVMKQLNKYEPFVKKGGVITMHDIVHDPPVLKAIEDYFKNRDVKIYKYFNSMGFAVILKK
jgi:predicted O-methyltransferase YrrM